MMDQSTIDLCHKLNEIPHLNITKYLPKVPIKDMLKELLQFSDDDFYPYITGNKDQDLARHMAENWKGMCIIDSCNEGRHNIDYLTTENNFDKLTFNFDADGKPLYAPTDVGQLTPVMINYLYSIIDRPQKTRISRIMPNGGNATWHSHYTLALGGDKRFAMNDDFRLQNKIIEPVLHIPLITNKDVWFGVMPKHPGLFKDQKPIWQHYAMGEVWIFNSFFYHNVYNKGITPRDHIMMYIPFDDAKLMAVLQQAVDEYTGTRISMEELQWTI